MMLQSPSPYLTLELQGGEPLLALDTIKYIVSLAKPGAARLGKELDIVITSNLAFLTDDILDYCKSERIKLSTSLDGPEFIHNANRPRPGGDSYRVAIDGIKRARRALGADQVAALMTTTQLSLQHPVEIIDEYVPPVISHDISETDQPLRICDQEQSSNWLPNGCFPRFLPNRFASHS